MIEHSCNKQATIIIHLVDSLANLSCTAWYFADHLWLSQSRKQLSFTIIVHSKFMYVSASLSVAFISLLPAIFALQFVK
jgi:hypothetical protein